jgi:hypothetical protein
MEYQPQYIENVWRTIKLSTRMKNVHFGSVLIDLLPFLSPDSIKKSPKFTLKILKFSLFLTLKVKF